MPILAIVACEHWARELKKSPQRMTGCRKNVRLVCAPYRIRWLISLVRTGYCLTGVLRLASDGYLEVQIGLLKAQLRLRNQGKQMKFTKSALAGIALCAVTIASHAGFTASLLGPTALRPGYSGTFELTVIYTPIAIDPLESFGMAPPGSFDWTRGPATAGFHGAYFYKDGVEYARTYNFPGAIGSFSPFNANQPAVITRQFVWTAGDAGNYDMTFAIDKLESVGHYQNAQCWADPSCPRLGAINGTDDYFDVIEARFGVDVTSTAPIPELDTYAMMMVGLGLVSAFARRRQAK